MAFRLDVLSLGAAKEPSCGQVDGDSHVTFDEAQEMRPVSAICSDLRLNEFILRRATVTLS